MNIKVVNRDKDGWATKVVAQHNNSLNHFKNDLDRLVKEVDYKSFSVDSLKIRLELNKVNILSKILLGEFYIIDKETGEELTDFEVQNFKRSSFMHDSETGVKTYYRLEKQVTEHQTVQEYLTILITSKLFKDYRYFEGIRRKNIESIYNELIAHKIAEFSFSDFIKADITDVDIKSDFVLKKGTPQEFVKQLFSCAKLKKRAIEACTDYTDKENTGIQFSLRKTNSFRKSPFLKFYGKAIELTYKSKLFLENHLFDVKLPQNLIRMETTIKNKKHFKYLGFDSNTLEYVLDHIERIGKKAFQHALKKHLDMDKANTEKLIAKAKALNVNDKAFIYVINDFVNHKGFNLEDAIIEVASTFYDDRRRQSELRKRLFKIFEDIDYKKQTDDRLRFFIENILS